MSDDFPTVTWQEYMEMLQKMTKTGERFTGYVIQDGQKRLIQINPPRCPDCENAYAKPDGTCHECGKQLTQSHKGA